MAKNDRSADGAAQRLCRLLGSGAIILADVGAAGGAAKRWHPIARSLQRVAFEPDLRSEPRDSRDAEVVTTRKAAAAAAGPRTLFLTRKPRSSSLLPPNLPIRKRFLNPERAEVVEEALIECTTIDAAFEELALRPPDFLTIDTQGTELEVLRGAEAVLPACLGIEVEVQFQPLYVGAGLFRSVDAHLADRGFELYDLRRDYFLRSTTPAVAQERGQIAYGDALYFRDWRTVPQHRETMLRLSALLLVYGYADVVTEILPEATALTDADRVELAQITSALSGEPSPREDKVLGTGFGLRRGEVGRTLAA
jgi:FkbM family methyltransferase